MRMNGRITFVREEESRYDPSKGEWVEGKLNKTTKPCNVSTLGIDRTKELFGELDTVITVARLQHPYTGQVDYVFLNGNENKRFEIKRQSSYRKGVFYLEGTD